MIGYTHVIQINFMRNMDEYIIKTLGKYGITFEDKTKNARNSKLRYDLLLLVNEKGEIKGIKTVTDAVRVDEETQLFKLRGTKTCLDNLPSRLQLLGVPAGWYYGKDKKFAKNVPFGQEYYYE